MPVPTPVPVKANTNCRASAGPVRLLGQGRKADVIVVFNSPVSAISCEAETGCSYLTCSYTARSLIIWTTAVIAATSPASEDAVPGGRLAVVRALTSLFWVSNGDGVRILLATIPAPVGGGEP